MTGIDDAINEAFRPIATAVVDFVFFSVPIGEAELPLIVVWLIAGALFFTKPALIFFSLFPLPLLGVLLFYGHFFSRSSEGSSSGPRQDMLILRWLIFSRGACFCCPVWAANWCPS